MLKKFTVVFILFTVLSFSQNRHGLFTSLLKDYVSEGKVNYSELKDDSRLEQYLKILSSTKITNLDKKEQLAFYINAYNAFTLKVIVDNYPVESINDLHFGGLVLGSVLKSTIWDKEFIEIGGETLSLNNIEHDIIRPKINDPRVHFALVCASKSCPALRSEAYEADKLDEQLDDQAVRFFDNSEKNKFDIKNKVAYLSKMFDWYDSDFGENDQQILKYAAKYTKPGISKKILEDTPAWEIEYLDYDWSLNE